MTRIGAEFVMRDGVDRCVRIPVATTDAGELGARWAEFSRSAPEVGGMQGPIVTAGRRTVHRVDTAMVLQGYTTNTHGVCLARVAGYYVTRDGVRRCIRFLVDTLDPARLGAAFSVAAGWAPAASGVRIESVNHASTTWTDTGEDRSAFG